MGDVAYDDRPGTEAYWFEVDEEHAGGLSLSGSPWLACLLPLAATLGQKLRSAHPSTRSSPNAPRLMETWKTWYRKRFPTCVSWQLKRSSRRRPASAWRR